MGIPLEVPLNYLIDEFMTLYHIRWCRAMLVSPQNVCLPIQLNALWPYTPFIKLVIQIMETVGVHPFLYRMSKFGPQLPFLWH